MQFAKSHKYKKGKDLGREKCKKVTGHIFAC